MTLHILSDEFRRSCENIAMTVRHERGLYAFQPLPARSFAEHLEIDVVTPDKMDGLPETTIQWLFESLLWSAITILTKPPLIVVHPKHAPVRLESDVMHELAHVLLKHVPEQLFAISERYVTRQYSKPHEQEAEYLGGCLQIPAAGLDHARQSGWNKAETASYFGSSERMVQFRLNMTGRSLKASGR